MIAALYDLHQQRALRAALRDLRGYWKLWSTCLLQSVSLPTLRGIVVTRWSPEIDKHLHVLLKRINGTKVLIRHDIQNEAPPYPRGGFLVPKPLLPQVLDFFFGLDRIVAIYEAADPLLNGYNLNLLFEDAKTVWVEVVGPGFDASDLQRGDLSPHEVFSLAISADGKVLSSQRVRGIDHQEYKDSKQLRQQKIQRKMKEWPTPELAHEIRRDCKFPETTEEYLKSIGSPLYAFEEYAPIPKTIIVETVAAILNSRVIDSFRSEAQVGFPLNFSTSFIHRGERQVFWDIVSPSLKFQGSNGLGRQSRFRCAC